jgi:hypothetical protein
MKYLLMIYEDENVSRQRSEADNNLLNDAYVAYTRALREAGVLLGGDAVRVRQGKTTMTDGPFAETKEQLGGYYLIDVPDLDAALKWAERLPSAQTGSIEVRPLANYEV